MAKGISGRSASPSEFVAADNHAYSVVLNQAYMGTSLFARVSVVGNGYYYSTKDYQNGFLKQASTNLYGSLLLFQTRWKEWSIHIIIIVCQLSKAILFAYQNLNDSGIGAGKGCFFDKQFYFVIDGLLIVWGCWLSASRRFPFSAFYLPLRRINRIRKRWMHKILEVGWG